MKLILSRWEGGGWLSSTTGWLPGPLWGAVGAVRQAGASHIAVAVPVSPPDAVARVEALGADVLALARRSDFLGVGQFSEDFAQVPEDECIATLLGSMFTDQRAVRCREEGRSE